MASNISSSRKQNIQALILVGSRDFGRCPLASRLPTALWPIAGQTILERLLVHLADQGIKQIVICSGEDSSLLAESIQVDNRLEVEYLDEPLPVGTAGSIREAAKDKKGTLFILFTTSLVCPPDIDTLISEHNRSNSDLTVVLNQEHHEKCEGSEQASGIYICSTSVLEHIPKDGYCDIKEGLIPKMLRAGKNVHAVTLSHNAGNFRNCHEYLQAVTNNIENIAGLNNLKPYEVTDSYALLTGDEIQIDPTARFVGQVIIMDGVIISEGAVVIGPSVLGKNVTVGKNCVIVNSILWDDVLVNPNCCIDNCVVDYNTNLLSCTNVREECLIFKPLKGLNGNISKSVKSKWDGLQQIFVQIYQKFPELSKTDTQKIFKLLAPTLVFIAFVWSYWSGLIDLWKAWLRSDEYSSGLLVPFLAVYILWLRREKIAQTPIKSSIFGVFLFVFAQALRIFGLFFLFGSAIRLSIVLSIAALVLLLFGWKLFRKVGTVLLFLFLMLPWPYRIQAAVSLPLQQWSTSSAVFFLELMGFEILQEGNVIHIGQSTVAVAEACNGLRMITAFFVISGLVALLVNRAWWEKLIVLVSSLPIALLCNTVRLSITAIFFTVLEGEYWEKIFHDFGGYAMMPLALAVIVAELWLITKLTVPPEEKEEIIIVRKKR